MVIISSIVLFFLIIGGVFWAFSFITDAIPAAFEGFGGAVTGSRDVEWPPRER